jgi:hypothetical protein
VNAQRCAICGEDCQELEPSFLRPDAVFAVPADERPARVKQTDDLVSVDDAAFFIRCVAPIPVRGREEPYGWGFWVKVSAEHFQEYLRFFSVDPPADHPGFQGTIANQTRLAPPTLGLPVHVHLGRGQARPRLMLLDDAHALTRQQVDGITPAEAHALSDRCGADEDLDPPAPWSSPSLEVHGWRLGEPERIGRAVVPVDPPPRPGDLVKVPIVFLAADARGEVGRRTELMWVRLDEVGADGRWSGTLHDQPFVPGAIGRGSRIWLRPSHVIGLQREAAADPPVVPGPAAAAPAPLRRFWRRLLGR